MTITTKSTSLSLLELALAKKVARESLSITTSETSPPSVTLEVSSTGTSTESSEEAKSIAKPSVNSVSTLSTLSTTPSQTTTPPNRPSSQPSSQPSSLSLLELAMNKKIEKVEKVEKVVSSLTDFATPNKLVKGVSDKVSDKVPVKPTESIEAAKSKNLPTPSLTSTSTSTPSSLLSLLAKTSKESPKEVSTEVQPKTEIGNLIKDVIVAMGEIVPVEVKTLELDDKLPESLPATGLPDTLPATRTATKLASLLDSYIGEDKLNAKQKQAVSYALDGKSYCLIGAAGSGKTTAIAEIIYKLSTIYAISDIAICAYTRKAANNVKVAMAKHPYLKEYLEGGAKFVSTIHRLLGFRPEEFDKFDLETGTVVKSRKFVPFYTEDNLLNKKLVLIDEGSMVAVELFKQLYAANPNATYIFIGDINQLPPAFGDAILGYALCKLPVIELTEIYRQALDSPIVGFQHKFSLKGIAPSDSDLTNMNMLNRIETKLVDGLSPLRFVGYKPKVDIKDLTKEEGNKQICKELAGFFYQEYTKKSYRPMADIILVPQNVGVGTFELNRQIANFIDYEENRTVYEVIAAFTKLYFAVGDKVMFDKDDFVIEDIIPNPEYNGVEPKTPAVGLLRCGLNTKSPDEKNQMSFEDALEQVDFISNSETPEGEDDRVIQISHEIKLRSLLDSSIKSISSLSELRKMELAYCLTVYKSQGSEWERVYFICLNKHARMLDRETLYTAMTRAKKNLVVLYSPETYKGAYNSTVAKCIANPSIKGVNLKEKLVQFTRKSAEFIAKMEADPFEGMLQQHSWR